MWLLGRGKERATSFMLAFGRVGTTSFWSIGLEGSLVSWRRSVGVLTMEKLKGGVNAVLDRVCVGGGKVVQAFVRGMKCSKGCRGR